MPNSTTLVGIAGLAVSLVVFVYYTAWVLVEPFVDPSVTWFHALFPDRYWAYVIPTTLLVVGVSLIATVLHIISRDSK